MSRNRHQNIPFPNLWQVCSNDKVAISIVTPEQKICFLVQNREVADSYIEYFNLLWKNAIEP
ncbi:hypothetical protein HYS31_05370 [Candidatus Woesearchaeota archaeon]|nr:hypothetical protein [Candidatus Woesearchaeota archaeon]